MLLFLVHVRTSCHTHRNIRAVVNVPKVSTIVFKMSNTIFVTKELSLSLSARYLISKFTISIRFCLSIFQSPLRIIFFTLHILPVSRLPTAVLFQNGAHSSELFKNTAGNLVNYLPFSIQIILCLFETN